MNPLTHDDTSVTLDTGVIQTRIVRNPKHVVARLIDLGVEHKPPLKARRIFQTVCRFYSTIRSMSLILLPDQPIKHEIQLYGETLVRTGHYRAGVLLWEDKEYTSLTAFAIDHYRAVHPTRTTANGWAECQTLVEGEWKRMTHLRERFLKGIEN
jgi:hypothetical protein